MVGKKGLQHVFLLSHPGKESLLCCSGYKGNKHIACSNIYTHGIKIYILPVKVNEKKIKQQMENNIEIYVICLHIQ